MSEEFIGAIVHIDCGERGNYQGKLSAIDLKEMTVTLSEAMKNGEKSKKKFVLHSGDMKDLKVIKIASETKAVNPKAAEKPAKKIKIPVAKNGADPTRPSTNNAVPSKSDPGETQSNHPMVEKILNPFSEVGDNQFKPQTNFTIMKREPVMEAPPPVVSSLMKRDPMEVAVIPSATRVIPTSVIRANANKKKEPKIEAASKNEPVVPEENAVPEKADLEPVKSFSAETVSSTKVFPEIGIRIDPQSFINSVSLSPKVPKMSSQSSPESSQQNLQKSSSSSGCNFQKFGSFKKFTEKQQPMPTKLQRSGSNRRKNKDGPSGMPLVDLDNGYGPVHKKNAHLDEDIDSELLNTDFDFEANGNFDDESVAESNSDSAPVRNYRNDENVVNDTSRVTTWETMNQLQKHLPISQSGFTYARDGCSKIPVLTIEEKKRFTQVVEQQLGKGLLLNLTADRLVTLFLQVVNSMETEVNNVAIVASKDVERTLLDRICTHLTNRKINVTCIGCKTSISNSLVVSVNDAKDVKDIELVFILDEATGVPINPWLKQVSNGKDAAPVIVLEGRRNECEFVHALYIGTLTETKARKNIVTGEITRYVADIGIPYSIFTSEAADALADAFALSEMVKL